jgi:hypothetical protein
MVKYGQSTYAIRIHQTHRTQKTRTLFGYNAPLQGPNKVQIIPAHPVAKDVKLRREVETLRWMAGDGGDHRWLLGKTVEQKKHYKKNNEWDISDI